MRDATTAARALRSAGIEKINKKVYEDWLAQASVKGGKTNAVVHAVGASDLNAVRKVFDGLAPATTAVEQGGRPARHERSGKKAQAEKAAADPRVAAAPIPRPSAREMVLEYGDEHGKLHFGGKPTRKKSKWSLDKPVAVTLMETEIRKHLDRLVADSKLDGAEVWYVSGDNGTAIGNYLHKDGGSAPTSTFSMQVQVLLADKLIHYHGYPDERVQNVGAGKGRNVVGQ